jgi:pimeloyl-ACP methyl ester carboxylesterase
MRGSRWSLYGCCIAGALALGLGAMLAAPLTRPPILQSVHAAVRHYDLDALPPLSRFAARDGTSLAYRLYAAGTQRLAILVHGSSGSSLGMNAMGKALAAQGITAVAIDVRGHGESGPRGDVAYIGQIEDDLADLVGMLRADYPQAKLDLIGHSLGGGFVARVAASPLGANFDRFVMTAPFLGPLAPTNRPSEGKGRWADVDRPRILALTALSAMGITAGQGLPVIAYANDPHEKRATPIYSFRLLASFGPPYDFDRLRQGLAAAAPRVTVIAGADDELMDAPAYARTLSPLGVKVEVLPGLDHMAVTYDPTALAAVVAAAKGETREAAR